MGIDPIDHVVHKDADGNIDHGDGGASPDRQGPAVHLDSGVATPGTGSEVKDRGLPKEGTKLGALIAALRNAEGATIAELMQATAWQAHSVRGAISGSLKKKLKLTVVSETVESRGRVYRISGDEASG